MTSTPETITPAPEVSAPAHQTAVLAATRVCALADLAVERGVAALVDGHQLALVRLREDTVYAVSQRDPFSGANVISRGIVGTRAGEPTIASPMYKQVFSLRTGRCLDHAGRDVLEGEQADLRSWPIRVRDGVVYLLGQVSR